MIYRKCFIFALLFLCFRSNAAICVYEHGNTTIRDGSIPINQCADYVLLDINDYKLMVDSQNITSTEIVSSFSWGFGTYIFFWWLGYVIKNARMVIRKA
jgi:hypothetical protein